MDTASLHRRKSQPWRISCLQQRHAVYHSFDRRHDAPEKAIVAEALVLFEKYGMITLEQTGEGFCIRLTNWTKYQNAEALERIREQNRIRKANQRERERLLRKSPDYGL